MVAVAKDPAVSSNSGAGIVSGCRVSRGSTRVVSIRLTGRITQLDEDPVELQINRMGSEGSFRFVRVSNGTEADGITSSRGEIEGLAVDYDRVDFEVVG